MDDEQPQTGSSGSLSIVRAAAVLILFVVAVAVLVSVGTRPSVSSTPTTTTPTTTATAAGSTTTTAAAGAAASSTTTTTTAHHTTTTKAGHKGSTKGATTTTTAPHSATTVVVANATTVNGLAAHYSTVIGAGGWTMQTPLDASTSEATSAVYYAPGQQEQAASIATTIGVKPAQVLPDLRGHAPQQHDRHRRGGRDRVGPGGVRLDDDHRGLTLPAVGDAAAARLPELLRPLAADPQHSALFLDFDGTLSAVVKDPRDAAPLPGVPDLLAELAAAFALVAVISGRPTAFLDEVLGPPPGVTLAGLYGLERALQGSAHDTWAAVIDEVVAEALATAPEGVYVEPKGLTVTLHFRRAPEHKDWVVDFAERQHVTRGLAVVQGRLERELRPPLDVDKGTVVRSLVAEYDERGEPLRALAAFGDDLGRPARFRRPRGAARRRHR